MSKLVSKQSYDDPVTVHSSLDFCNHGITAVDPNDRVVRLGCIRIVGLPNKLHMNPSAIMMSFTLRGSHLFQPASKEPGGEKLLIGDLTALFIHEL